MKKIKYIFKKLLVIFLIAIISIFLYQIFIELKNSSNNEETYGTRLSADKQIEDNREDIILSLMRENPKISISAISKTTGLSKKQIEKAIDILKSSKRLHREGPDKGGSWIVDD